MGDGKKAPWTKGPWRVGRGSVVADHPVPGICGSEDVDYYGGHLIAESVAPQNVHIIAAAPALAEAALPFAAFIDVWLTMFGTTPKSGAIYSINSGAGSVELTVENFLAIRAALSLARGEKG